MTREQKITLGEMRASGVHGLLIYCSDFKCSHWTAISADRWPDYLRLSDMEPRFTSVRRAAGEARMYARTSTGKKRGPDVPFPVSRRPQPHVSTMTQPCETFHCDWRRPATCQASTTFIQLDKKIEHYERLALGMADELTLERIRESVREMRAQKAALHPEQEQQ
jgi:hypothetical protein